MPRKSSVKVDPNGLLSLMDLAIDQLDVAIHRPNINSYKPYPAQYDFHTCTLTGRYMSAGNRAGKCLVEGTLVQMADGRVKAIQDITAGEYVIAPDGTATQVTAVWDQGMKDVNEYRFGRYQDSVSVTCTPDHKFWGRQAVDKRRKAPEVKAQPVRDLMKKDAKVLRSSGTRLGGVRESRAHVLGLMLGDGHLSERAPSNLQFTCADPDLAAAFPVFVQRAEIQYSFTAETRKDYFEWFSELGVLGTRSGNKFIPDEVWSWDEESIAEVIAGLAETDGSWWVSTEGEHHFAYTSKSRQLIEDFRRYAGMRLGIWGSTVNKGSKGTWQITYGTKEALSKLAKLPLKGRKQSIAQEAVPKRSSLSSQVKVQGHTDAGRRHCYDITVAHETHCFMLANGLFTSNTTAAVIDCIDLAMNRCTWRARDPRWGTGAIRLRWVAVDVDKGVLGIAIPEFKRWMSPSMMVNGSWEDSWNASSLTLTFSNGSTVQFLTHGMELDKHGGVALHGIYFDEIPPHAVFNENLMRLVDYEGYWVIAATSVEGMGWTYELLWEPADLYRQRMKKPDQDPEPQQGENADIGIFELSQKDNPYLKTAVKDRGKYYVGMDENERLIREEGAFLARSGRVFPSWNIHDHVLPEHFLPSENWRIYTSVDFGWSNPTAWLWHAVHPDGRVYTFAEHYKSEMPVAQHAEIVLAKEAFMRLDGSKIMRVGDPNNGNAHVINGISYVSEYANNGIYIGTENIPRDVQIGIEKMQQYIRLERRNAWGENKPRWMISPNCSNLIRELKKLRRASYESAKKAFDMNKREEVHKKDDHAFDSARYFFTFMPELAPSVEEVIEAKAEQGITLTYDQTMAMLRSDDRVEFVNDKQDWEIEYLSEFEEI